MKSRKRQIIPPHVGAEVHERIFREAAHEPLEVMRADLIEAGIMTPSGELAEYYRDKPARGRKRVRRAHAQRRASPKRTKTRR